MNHSTGKDPVVIALVHERGKKNELLIRPPKHTCERPADTQDGKADRDSEADQDLGGDWVEPNGTSDDLLLASVGALRAMKADRGGILTVATDRPLAALADHSRPAVPVPVAENDSRFPHKPDASPRPKGIDPRLRAETSVGASGEVVAAGLSRAAS